MNTVSAGNGIREAHLSHTFEGQRGGKRRAESQASQEQEREVGGNRRDQL